MPRFAREHPTPFTALCNLFLAVGIVGALHAQADRPILTIADAAWLLVAACLLAVLTGAVPLLLMPLTRSRRWRSALRWSSTGLLLLVAGLMLGQSG